MVGVRLFCLFSGSVGRSGFPWWLRSRTVWLNYASFPQAHSDRIFRHTLRQVGSVHIVHIFPLPFLLWPAKLRVAKCRIWCAMNTVKKSDGPFSESQGSFALLFSNSVDMDSKKLNDSNVRANCLYRRRDLQFCIFGHGCMDDNNVENIYHIHRTEQNKNKTVP